MGGITLRQGSKFPSAVFSYIPYDKDACPFRDDRNPVKISSNDWKKLKVVLFSVPGAFTPTCTARHVPDVLDNYEEFKAKNVDLIAFVAVNDPFVMAAWGDSYGARDKILFLTDIDADFSSSIGCGLNLKAQGFGLRTSRYAIAIDHGTVIYAALEDDPNRVTVSGAKAVLAEL